jgi:predicted Zn-dependent protease
VNDPDVERARLLLAAGQCADAREAARQHLADDPTDFDAHLIASEASLDLGDADGCADHAQAALAAAPRHPDALRLLAHGAVGSGHFDKGRAAAADAVEIDPDAWQSHATFALVELTTPNPRLDAALRAARQAVQMAPRESTTHHVLGQVLLKRRRNKAAAAAFRAALAIDPQNPGVRWGLADALLRSERPGAALNEFAQLASEDPGQGAHSHNVLVAFGNSLRFVYFAVVVPYVVIVRIFPRVTEDGTALVRGLLALSVVLAFAIVIPLAIRFLPRLQITWRSLLALMVVQDRLLVAWGHQSPSCSLSRWSRWRYLIARWRSFSVSLPFRRAPQS